MSRKLEALKTEGRGLGEAEGQPGDFARSHGFGFERMGSRHTVTPEMIEEVYGPVIFGNPETASVAKKARQAFRLIEGEE